MSKKNSDLESECDRLKQKLSELMSSNSTNNNNLITANKNLPDLGEGVRSTIVTFNNAIANLAGSTVVNSQQVRQIPNVVQSLQSSKPSLAAKPSFDSLNPATNGKPTVTIINTTSSFNQPVRSNSVSSRHTSDQTASTKTISSLNKLNSSVSTTTANDVNSNISTSTTSVASVIQKFSNNTISNNTQPHPPIQRKQSSSGLVANIRESISQNTVGQENEIRKRPPPGKIYLISFRII